MYYSWMKFVVPRLKNLSISSRSYFVLKGLGCIDLPVKVEYPEKDLLDNNIRTHKLKKIALPPKKIYINKLHRPE